MRSTWTFGVATIVLATLGSGHVLAQTGPTVRLEYVTQTVDPGAGQYDDATGLWFGRQVETDGRITSEVRGKDLTVQKSYADGALTVVVRSGKQDLTLSVSRTQIEIRTGRRVLRFDPARATEAHYDAAKELLARSRVVGRLRAAAAGIGPKVRGSADGIAFEVTEALVALLDGDPSAALRVKERLRSQVLGTGLRSAGGRTIGECFSEYKAEVYRAMMDAQACLDDFPVWNVPMRNLCNLEWTIRFEAAWFEFVGCSVARAVRFD